MSDIIGKSNPEAEAGVFGFFARRRSGLPVARKRGMTHRQASDTRLTRVYFSNGCAQYLTVSGAIVQRP